MFVARPDYATNSWDIVCERLDGLSFARSPSPMDNLMLGHGQGQSFRECVHFMRSTFDDYNETHEMIYQSAAIHPHHMGLLMLRGISNTGHFGQPKQCVINAVDSNYLMSTDEVMASTLHLAQNMEDGLPGSDLTTPYGPSSPIYGFFAPCRGSHGDRGHSGRGGRAGRGLPNKCRACGSLDHIISSYMASDDAL
jgi:hypothetical protein